MPRWPTNLLSTPQMAREVLHFWAKNATLPRPFEGSSVDSSASAALMGPEVRSDWQARVICGSVKWRIFGIWGNFGDRCVGPFKKKEWKKWKGEDVVCRRHQQMTPINGMEKSTPLNPGGVGDFSFQRRARGQNREKSIHQLCFSDSQN